MEEEFAERFSTYSDEKLLSMLLHHEQYKQEALDAALTLLKKRGKLSEARELLEGKKERLEQVEEEKRTDAQEQVERLKTIDFGRYFSFGEGSADQFEFQQQLLDAEIPFQTSEGFYYARPIIKYHVAADDFEHANWLYYNSAHEEKEEETVDDVKPRVSANISDYRVLGWIIGILLLTLFIVIVGSYLSMPA